MYIIFIQQMFKQIDLKFDMHSMFHFSCLPSA